MFRCCGICFGGLFDLALWCADPSGEEMKSGPEKDLRIPKIVIERLQQNERMDTEIQEIDSDD